MTSQTYPAKKISASKSGVGIKMLIMAASLTATMGGWAVLAFGQMRDAVNIVQQPPAIVQPASAAVQNSARSTNSQSQPAQRQVTAPTPQPKQQPRVVGRTRSSR